jgi:diguanylate cyclase (GGDEF)-like protein
MGKKMSGTGLSQQTDRLGLISEIGRAVTGTLDLQTLYDRIYQQIGRVMDTSLFFIALHQPESSQIDFAYLREGGKLYFDQRVPYGPNVTSTVIDHAAPLYFQDVHAYLAHAQANGLPDSSIGVDDPEAMIFVPLTTGDRTIGALSVQSLEANAYSQDDVQTLSVIASQAAVAIENAHLYARSQTNVSHMQALLQVAQAVNSSLDLKTVLDSILAGIRDVVPYHLAAVLLPDHARQQLDIVGAAGPLVEERRSGLKIPFGKGVTGTVFVTGRALNIGDVRTFESYVEHGIPIRSELTVPLKRGETVVGVLDVERTEVDSFSASEVGLLTLFASQAAIAIENARLFAQQQRRVFELQTIQSIVQKITPLHDVPAIAEVINDELKQLINYHACRILSLDEEEQVLTPIEYAGPDTSDLRLHLGEGISGWVAERGESAIISSTLEDSRVTQIAGTPLREESIIAVPLVYEDRVRGVISLSCLGTRQFDENALRLLEIIAAQAAIAFDRSRLYEQLRTEAITDPVTRLYNRRYLLERFKEEKSRSLRNEHELVAIMLDIDKFKRVNDAFGHDAGDVVLQELATIVRAVVRQEDLVSRYGGEEFCILLPEVSLEDAEAVAQRLCSAIAHHRLPSAAGVRSITVSAGVAALSSDDEAGEVFSRADLAMYEVKRRGGNQVCLADGFESSHLLSGRPLDRSA